MGPTCVNYSNVSLSHDDVPLSPTPLIPQKVPACLSQTGLFPRPKSYMHPSTETRQSETDVVPSQDAFSST